MATQGKITNEIADKLIAEGWKVVYKCIPNTPHIGVVPIPTSSGSSSQRYPDIVAYKDDEVRFVEVEIKLNAQVAKQLIERFDDYTGYLSKENNWALWKQQVFQYTGHMLPNGFCPVCDLVICSPVSTQEALLELLRNHKIRCQYYKEYII